MNAENFPTYTQDGKAAESVKTENAKMASTIEQAIQER